MTLDFPGIKVDLKDVGGNLVADNLLSSPVRGLWLEWNNQFWMVIINELINGEICIEMAEWVILVVFWSAYYSHSFRHH